MYQPVSSIVGVAESKLGTQSQSTAPSAATNADVWQLERKA